MQEAEEVTRLIEERVRKLAQEFGDPLVRVKDEHEFQKLLSSSRIVVALFSASWCNPCKAYTPVFRRVARKVTAEHKDIVFAYIDTDEAQSIADRYSVDNIPATIIFVDGHVADMVTGVIQEHRLLSRVREIARSVLA